MLTGPPNPAAKGRGTGPRISRGKTTWERTVGTAGPLRPKTVHLSTWLTLPTDEQSIMDLKRRQRGVRSWQRRRGLLYMQGWTQMTRLAWPH